MNMNKNISKRGFSQKFCRVLVFALGQSEFIMGHFGDELTIHRESSSIFLTTNQKQSGRYLSQLSWFNMRYFQKVLRLANSV